MLLFCLQQESHGLDPRLTCGQMSVVEEHGMEEVGFVGNLRLCSSPVTTEDILVRPRVIGPVLENKDDDLIIRVTGDLRQSVQQVHWNLLQILNLLARTAQTQSQYMHYFMNFEADFLINANALECTFES